MSQTFHPFPDLPLELREMIGQYCLPRKVCELDSPVAWLPYKVKEDDPVPCELSHTSYLNDVPPLITRVCRESRSVAFSVAKQALKRHDLTAYDDACGGFISSPRHEVNKGDDRVPGILHMWTTPTYEVWFDHGGTHGDLDAIHYLANSANESYTPSTHVRASMVVDSLPAGVLWDESVLDNPEHHGFNVQLACDLKKTPEVYEHSENQMSHIEALKQLRGKYLVVLHVLVIHTDYQTGIDTGLFGLLGDAPIQIIHMAEEEKTERFYALAEACERKSPVTVPQEFKRVSYQTGKQKLRDSIVRSYGTEELVDMMQPAIMFRLCTKTCNHLAP